MTGGSSGIGRAVAELLAENGAKVVLADIADASDVAEDIHAHYLRCDVSDEQSVRLALESATQVLGGKLNTVILNAGVGDVGPTLQQSSQDLIDKITRINQWGVLYGLKHAPDYMEDNGSIIATSSMASVLSMPGTGVYSAAKAAVNSMVSMAALELGSRGIRVNSICPGYVNTELGNSVEEQRISQVFTALGRHAEPKEDIAGVFLFLASAASQYITGQALQVDGGWRSGPTTELLKVVTGTDQTPGS